MNITTYRSITEVELCTWLGSALTGDKLTYHRGFLTNDCHPSTSQLPKHQRTELARVARRAWAANEMGLAVLVQRRHGPKDYTYIIIARIKPRAPRSHIVE